MILFTIENGKNTCSQSMSGCFCYVLFWLMEVGWSKTLYTAHFVARMRRWTAQFQ